MKINMAEAILLDLEVELTPNRTEDFIDLLANVIIKFRDYPPEEIKKLISLKFEVEDRNQPNYSNN